MRTIILAAAALALAGCGFYHWHKDNADNAAFQRDSAACEQQSGAAPPAAIELDPTQPTHSPWEGCMTSKGWIYSSGW